MEKFALLKLLNLLSNMNPPTPPTKEPVVEEKKTPEPSSGVMEQLLERHEKIANRIKQKK